MQVNSDSATLARQEIALVAPTRTDRAKSTGRLRQQGCRGSREGMAFVFSNPTHALIRMRKELNRGETWEDMVWVLIGLCSLTVIVLSLV